MKHNSQLVADYFYKKIRKKHNGLTVAKIVEKDLQKFKAFFLGLKMRLRGRFTKKQRASYKNYRFGKVSLNHVKFDINYHQINLSTRYGAVSVKVWFTSKPKSEDLHFLNQNYLNYNFAKKIN